MGKRVFMFPGQGSQYVGMGKGFYDSMPQVKKIFELASEKSGLDIPNLCFTENDKLNITEYTQICMLTVEAALYKALVDKGITPDVTAGLSLGEYGALIASGAMTMEDAFGVVRKRGIYMQEAVPTGGAMTAVLGLDPEKIEEICKETAQKESAVVSIANYNCPGQIVITGQKDAVDKAQQHDQLEEGALAPFQARLCKCIDVVERHRHSDHHACQNGDAEILHQLFLRGNGNKLVIVAAHGSEQIDQTVGVYQRDHNTHHEHHRADDQPFLFFLQKILLSAIFR